MKEEDLKKILEDHNWKISPHKKYGRELSYYKTEHLEDKCNYHTDVTRKISLWLSKVFDYELYLDESRGSEILCNWETSYYNGEEGTLHIQILGTSDEIIIGL